MIINKCILILGFWCTTTLACAQEIDMSILQGHEAVLVIYNRGTGEIVNLDPRRSAQRFSPCSTFKIYNTLIGLELGLIHGPDEPWYKWDRVRRETEGWNRDLTLREAFQVSAVPAYQRLARQIGAARMKDYIKKIGYGSQDISSGIDVFWLPRTDTISIKISADEQVAILNKLLDGKLPFSVKNIAILRDVMLAEKTTKGALYGKTGSGMGPDGKWTLGWFVGFLEHNNTTYVFACLITEGENPSGRTARMIIENIFKSQSML